MKKMFNFALFSKFTEKQRYLYYKSMETERDRQNIIRTAEKKALAKGLAEGRAEGSRLKSLEIARNLMHAGVAIEVICSSTGLTEAEVKALQQS